MAKKKVAKKKTPKKKFVPNETLKGPEKQRYVDAVKKFQPRLNFNGGHYLTILKIASKQYHADEKEAEVLFETCKKKWNNYVDLAYTTQGNRTQNET
jgi:hypothetical protein